MDVTSVEPARSLGDPPAPARSPEGDGSFADLLSTNAGSNQFADRDQGDEASNVEKREGGVPAEVDVDAEMNPARPAGPRSRQLEQYRDEAVDEAPAMEPAEAQVTAAGPLVTADLQAGAAGGTKPGEASMPARALDATPKRLAGLEAGQPSPDDAPGQATRLVAPVAPGREPPAFKPIKPTEAGPDGKPSLALPGPADDREKLVLREHVVLRSAPATGPGGPAAADQGQVFAKRTAQPGTGAMPGRAATTAGHGEPGQASMAPAAATVEPVGAAASGPSAPTTADQPAGTALPAPSLTATPATPALPGARAPSAAPGAAEQIAVQLRQAADTGQSRVTIRLHPADLGRIDVILEWSEDGALRALLTAEKSETLDLLQRDARDLARALQEAGLKSGREDLTFDLRSGGGDLRKEDDRQGPAEDTARDPSEHLAELESAATGGHEGLLDLTV